MRLMPCSNLNRLRLTLISTALVNGILITPVLAQNQSTEKPNHPQIIKMKLDSASRNEWIRLEVDGDTVKVLHTTMAERGYSRTAHMLPIPLPLPRLYTWHDHHTTHLAFQPDSCQENAPSATQPSDKTSNQSSSSANCMIEGTDSLVIPEGMDIHQGKFKIDYTEGSLLRSITFKVPYPK